LKRKLVLYYIFIVILLFIALKIFSEFKVEQQKNEAFVNITKQIKQETKTFINDKKEKTLIIALALSKDTIVKNALLKNDSSLLSLQEISQMYAKDSSLKNVWLHIVKKDGTSFIKSWTNRRGENILGIRQDIVKFLKDPKITQTISVGKFDITIKAQVPIYHNKKLIGIFEVVTKLNSIAKKLQKDDFNPIILADKSYKKQLTIPFTKKFIGDYYVANLNANTQLLKLLKKQNLETLINNKDNYQLVKNYFLTIYNIDNKHDKHIGYIFLFKDINKIDLSEIYTTDRNFIFKWISIIIVGVLLLLILLNRHYTKQLKNDVLEKTEENVKQMKIIQEQEKLASMGEMIGNIAHQWRQPLSVISTGATGLQVQKKYNLLTDKYFIETCDLINDNAQYLSKTIDDFRNFIKGDRKVTKFKLSDTIKSFLHLIKSSIKNHNIKILENLDDNITINGHPNELNQCFINIFNNSKDAFKETLTKEDTMNEKNKEKLFFISTYLEDNQAIITFKDNAGGIPANVLPKIFEPYFTTKHKSQGTGLGLHMTYNLITKGMGGTITADNVMYKYKDTEYTGAMFTITLPLSKNFTS